MGHRRRRSWVSQVGQISSLTNHLVIATLLLGRQSELVPDVHPVTILAVNALTADFNLNLCNHLLTRAVKPTSVDASLGVLASASVGFRICWLISGRVTWK